MADLVRMIIVRMKMVVMMLFNLLQATQHML